MKYQIGSHVNCRKLFSLFLTLLTLSAGFDAGAAMKCGSFLGAHNQWALVQAEAIDHSVETAVRAHLEFAEGRLYAKRLSRQSAKAWTLATSKSMLGRERRAVVILQDRSALRVKPYATTVQVEDALAFLLAQSPNFEGLAMSDFAIGTQAYGMNGEVRSAGVINYIVVRAAKVDSGVLTESRALDLMRLIVTMVQDSGA